MGKEIPIKCEGNRYLPYSQLKHFQGNLKEMSRENAEKLKNSILEHGWIAPVFVWNNDQILDGHGRLLVLDLLLEEGYSISDIPVVDIHAETKKEAAKILLAINSHYQNITDQGLYEYMSLNELDMADLKDFTFSDITDMARFGVNFFEDIRIPNGNKPINEDAMADTKNECPKCGFKW